MAMTVKIRTEKTKTEKQRLLMSFMMFWAMGSVVAVLVLVVELESFIFRVWDLNLRKRRMLG